MLYFWHYVANKVLTTLSNVFTNLNLTDMETCYKVFRREVLQDITLKSNRFGFEPEITAKIAQRRNPAWRIYEIPISYSGRTYEEGKKIGLRDAFNAFYCISPLPLFRLTAVTPSACHVAARKRSGFSLRLPPACAML